MISWLWLIPVVFISSFLGAAAIGMANVAGQADRCKRCRSKSKKKEA